MKQPRSRQIAPITPRANAYVIDMIFFMGLGAILGVEDHPSFIVSVLAGNLGPRCNGPDHMAMGMDSRQMAVQPPRDPSGRIASQPGAVPAPAARAIRPRQFSALCRRCWRYQRRRRLLSVPRSSCKRCLRSQSYWSPCRST